MKKIILFSIFLAFIQPAFSQSTLQSQEIVLPAKLATDYTIVKQHFSVKEASNQPSMLKRSVDFPTQIVRMQGELKGQSQSCQQVLKTIETFLSDHFTYDKFFYNT